MATFEVTIPTDNGLGNTTGTLSKAILDANNLPGDDTIVIKNNVTLSGEMIQLIDSNITITGDDPDTVEEETAIISGDDTYRPLFVRSGTVNINNLTLTNGKAQGGNSDQGGGGAGMGGALFIYDGNVSVDSVNFSNNQAIGGDSGDATASNVGGGIFSTRLSSNNGTDDIGDYGGYDGNGGDGGFLGDGGQGIGGDNFSGNGGDGNGGDGGFGGDGGDGDGGYSYSGNGGDGYGGDGGFGGGGGQGIGGDSDGDGYGGDGGFGGGGGQGIGGDSDGFSSGGNRGYGGGNGGFSDSLGSNSGDGGYGMGGAVFIRSGSLNISQSTFSNNTATGGSGVSNGEGLGGGIFAMKLTGTNFLGSDQGMPTSLPTVTIDGSTTFDSNDAADAGTDGSAPEIIASGDDQNNDDLFGITITRSNAVNNEPVRFDFNSDGVADILWRNGNNGGNRIWFMDDDGTRNSQRNIQRLGTAWDVAGVDDFNDDGVADILWRHGNNGNNRIWFMDDDGTRNTQANPGRLGTAWDVAGVDDFNDDGVADILWRHGNNGNNRIWFMNDNGRRSGQPVNPGRLGTAWDVAGLDDFNDDGVADILWRHGNNGNNRIWFMNDDGTRNTQANPGRLGTAWDVAGLDDFNDDGVADILWRNGNNGANRIWFMNDNGRRSGQPVNLGRLGTAWDVAGVADFNDDGVADILWRNGNNGANRIWLMDDDGTLDSSVNPGSIGNAWDVAFNN
ncbi:VCBS repeat-containing protein [Okeania sp. KiyG1]|uniref:FG-GAP repeat domain-containing protein n=1 Tax=Okeania sp. KiyG1 TaxID=2720165 RepID=UPI0019219E7C|nr:VCBS repeat-containing protein [Okeania sp. KiyG1]GGA43267.1 hypothetical protein CYANOKiyG1_61870 [Okeania sp. KiyG1]